jgi:RNA polymerase sigma-70 factor (ECF subfamily)
MANLPDQNRFVALLEEHKTILFKVAGSYCRNPADREDLVQEMIVQLWRSFGRYDLRWRFSTWMYRVALNVAISFYRSESRRPRTRALDESALLEVRAPAAESAALAEDLQLLHQLIEQLGELDRALVILYLDGNRYDTIAEILGISETNVGTRITRIKQRLRLEMTDSKSKEYHHGTR